MVRLLLDEALGLGKVGIPRLVFNKLTTETEQSEHKGIMNLLKGMFGTFRNTTAHAPIIKWEIKEVDALDMLSMASLYTATLITLSQPGTYTNSPTGVMNQRLPPSHQLNNRHPPGSWSLKTTLTP